MSRFKLTLFTAVMAVATAFATEGRLAQAQQRYLAPSSVLNVLRNSGNYITFSGQQCLKWETGGIALSRAEPGLGYPTKYVLSSTINGTIAMDGQYNECVAFVRMATAAPKSTTWKKGPPAIFSSGIQNSITQGTLLATFGADGKYSGHCVVFAGFRSDRGISVWDQNVAGRTIKWRAIPLTGRGGVNDAKSYFVVTN